MAGQLTQEIINELNEAFELFDKDKDGLIATTELGIVMRALGQNPNQIELQELIKEIDPQNKGTFNIDQFQLLMQTQMKEEKGFEQELIDAFKNFDKDGKGSVSIAELKEILMNLGDKSIFDEEFDRMISETDFQENGRINCQEFIKMMTSL